MASIPKLGEVGTSAVAHVVARIFPQTTYAYLGAFIPGLFFEISVFFGNPVLVCDWFINRSFSLGRSMLIAIALILAFIIGNGFGLIPGLIQYFFFRPVYKVWWFPWRRFCAWLLKPIAEWLIKKRPRLRSILEADRLDDYASDIGLSEHTKEKESAWRCWVALARRLLDTRYGIKSEELDAGQWHILYPILGIWTSQDLRGNLLFVYLEATGWAGLAASYLAPALPRSYFYFNVLLLVSGLLHDFYFVRRRFDPRASGYSNVVAVLRELRRAAEHKNDDTTAD